MRFVVSSHSRRGSQADPSALEDMAPLLRAGMGEQETWEELEHCPCACRSLGPCSRLSQEMRRGACGEPRDSGILTLRGSG